ncbi:MAG TPA: hypothetical protein DCL77_14630 [Prolixibacteraceae bacterium]|jgi:predicted transcriptional regulator|nr:hypothetical protein [Prolixibacteraceae bacterium]
MERTVTIWEAIREMRQLSAEMKTFSIVYMSYDRGRQKSTGMVRVDRAILRAQTPSDENRNADHMLNYMDRELNLPRQFYQILLMEFNGFKTIPEYENLSRGE